MQDSVITIHLWDRPAHTYMCGESLPWKLEQQSCVSKGDLCNYSMVTCEDCKETWEYIEGVIEHEGCEECLAWTKRWNTAIRKFKESIEHDQANDSHLGPRMR